MSEPALLRSAVENVVRNGLRYTEPGTSVEVTVDREGDVASPQVAEGLHRVDVVLTQGVVAGRRRSVGVDERGLDEVDGAIELRTAAGVTVVDELLVAVGRTPNSASHNETQKLN